MLTIKPCQNNISYKANIKSPKLKLAKEDFFINIDGYGRNYAWAEKVKNITDTAVQMIRDEMQCDKILQFISRGIKEANKIAFGEDKQLRSGILRTNRSGYDCDIYWAGNGFITEYLDVPRYSIYAERFNEKIDNPLKNPFSEIELTIPEAESLNYRYLHHAPSSSINKALDLIDYQYNAIHKRFKPEKISSKNLKEFNNRIAKIRWILAHATPWQRGSDAISNIFMRGLYKAFGIKVGESAPNISFDLEAYCTNLQEYQNRFPSYFKNKPIVIE